MDVKPLEVGTIVSQVIVSQTIAGQTIVGQSSSVEPRHDHFVGKENDRLMIGKKPPNQVVTEEENQGRKDLIIVQSSKINFCGQWCVKLFHLESTLRPVIRRAIPSRIYITASGM